MVQTKMGMSSAAQARVVRAQLLGLVWGDKQFKDMQRFGLGYT
jgi:hypothetical protein